MKRLAILGASGHGKVVADTALLCGWGEIVFFDDAFPNKTMNGSWLIQGNSQSLMDSMASFDGSVVAIGHNQTRLRKQQELESRGAFLPTIVHPAAVVSKHAVLGAGSVVFAHVVVNADTTVGKSVILNTACTVDHDCTLEDGVHISPGAHIAGGVCIGARSWVGIGATIRQCMTLGQDVVVGAGAAVVESVEHQQVVVGVPAKAMKENRNA